MVVVVVNEKKGKVSVDSEGRRRRESSAKGKIHNCADETGPRAFNEVIYDLCK